MQLGRVVKLPALEAWGSGEVRCGQEQAWQMDGNKGSLLATSLTVTLPVSEHWSLYP